MTEKGTRVFDFTRLEEVTGGDGEFEQELLEEFLADTPSVFTRLNQAAAGGDRQTLQNESHGLKGSSLSLGADGLGRIAARLEGHAREGNLDGAGALVRELESEFDRVRTAIQERLQRAA